MSPRPRLLRLASRGWNMSRLLTWIDSPEVPALTLYFAKDFPETIVGADRLLMLAFLDRTSVRLDA
jgi:hypothetical protein